MDKLLTELEKARGLVGFDPTMAVNEIEQLIEMEQSILDSKILTLDMRIPKQLSMYNLQVLVIALKSTIKS